MKLKIKLNNSELNRIKADNTERGAKCETSDDQPQQVGFEQSLPGSQHENDETNPFWKLGYADEYGVWFKAEFDLIQPNTG
jgi:hypothetical protein